MSDRERPEVSRLSRRMRRSLAAIEPATRLSLVAAAFSIIVITTGFIVQAWRRGYGSPMYLLQADYIGSLSACTMLSAVLMWRWRRQLGWFQVPMAPALTYTFLVLIAYAVRSFER